MMKGYKRNIFIFLIILMMFSLIACNQNTIFKNAKVSSSEATVNGGDFFEGRTMEMIVPFETGGGTDTFARFLQPYLTRHILGEPLVQIINSPGGGGINGFNEFVALKEPTGLNVLASTATTHIPYLLDDPAVQFDLKRLKPLMGLPAGGVVYVSSSLGIEEPKDILNADEDLILAGLSATGLDLAPILAFELLGADMQAILGYEGRGPTRVSLMQGESNVDFQSIPAYLENVVPMVENNEAVPLFTFGQLNADGEIVRDPVLPDLPTIEEFYEEIYDEKPSGEIWEALKLYIGVGFTVQKVIWTHEDVPEEAVTEINKAAEEVAISEDFLTEGKTVLGGYDLLVSDELDRIVKNMLDVDPEVINWIKTYLKENHGVERLE